MFGRRFTLFRLMGFTVRADLSWFFVLVLVTWSLATNLFPQTYKGLEPRVYWAMGAAGALILFGSVVVHELSHSLVARKYGLPMKGITLFAFGGIAEMEDEPATPKAELLMALAGPAASVVIGIMFLAISATATAAGAPQAVVAVTQYIGGINLVLAAFNLIPAFPLDGGRVLRSIVWWRKGDLRRATRLAANTGSAFGLLLIVLGVYSLITGNLVGGLWWILIGSFVRSAAAMSYQQVLVRQFLEGQPVSRFMNANPVAVQRSLPVSELVENFIYRFHHKMFPVMEGDRLVGCVTTREVKQLPRDQWDQQTVGTIAQKCDAANAIRPDADAMEALTKMGQNRLSRLLVVDQGRLAGIVTLKDLLQFLSVRMELADPSSKSEI